ncbi:GntR family transcriptional regulator [Streptomyces cavourensis]|jgi:DNA-binding GntR family transcriptional regulator|uniref:GntR family transcriptional regulator n=1 Tax=unclassified Achromobacter TaxID=2626865 RepID=UPI000E047D24|nr:GntR family transcriptional regulator [Streptomyces cavourensis]
MTSPLPPAADTARKDVNRTEIVYKNLRQAIIEQALLPGDKLPEDVIGERFGVSRTIVRGVLTRLFSEGLVDLRPNRGAAVARPSLEEAHDIFEARRCLERDVARRLVLHVTDAGLARLEQHVAQEEAARSRNSVNESIRLSGEFHILMAELSGNAVYARYVNEIVSRCSLILALYGRPHSSECAVSEHREIVASLRARDEKHVLHLLEHHLESVTARALLSPDGAGVRDIRKILDRYGT